MYAVGDSITVPRNHLSTGSLVLYGDGLDYGQTIVPILTVNGSHGTAHVYSDGTYDYTPDTDYSGSDSFEFEGYDGNVSDPATIDITVAGDVPVANDDDSFSVTAGQTLMGSISADGYDPNDLSLTFFLYGSSTTSGLGSVTLGTDGSFSYSTNEGFSGEDYFTYVVYNGTYYSDPGTISIAVSPP